MGSLVHLVRDAVRAPSSHNTQPWLFRIDGDTVELLADRTRALPVNDPDDRELTISCGAALVTLRIAAAAAGRHAPAELLPDPDAEPDLLARVTLTAGGGGPDVRLAEAIPLRTTYRRAFSERPVPPEALEALEAAAAQEGARLVVLRGDERERLADLVGRGDAALFADRRWRRELAAWMHPRRRGDGLAYAPVAGAMARFVVSHVDVGRRTGAKDRDLAEQAPAVAVLSTAADEPRDWLMAGQALQRVLLTAAADGIQASFLNQPLQAGDLRPAVGELIGGEDFPQVALRLGFPDGHVPPAPRRPVEEVLER